MTTEKTVLLSSREGVATITFNRPAAMNAINDRFVQDFTEVLQTIKEDPHVRAVILTGSGRAFCAGGDLGYLEQLNSMADARDFIAAAGRLTATIMNMEKPFIAMVNGVAAGAGFNLALACDLIYCAASARFAQSFARVGLVPDCGGMYLLPRVIGLHKAKELMFTADLIDARQALDWGIVNRVVDDEELPETVAQIAKRLAAAAPLPLGLIKRTLNGTHHLDADTVLCMEADLQALCMQSEDYREGVAAFREKRAARFTGQ